MKQFLLITMIILIAASAQATDVGVSVSVGQPGFYGNINIGNFPHPEVIYNQPVVVHPGSAHVVGGPIYLHVPSGHEKKWSKHCHKYNACGRPVYFVRDNWYNNVYVPHYKARGGQHYSDDRNPRHSGEHHDQGHGIGEGKGHGR
jgi:hypothetical protein